MPKAVKRILQIIGIILVLAVVVVGGYIIYLYATYYRIADNTAVEVENNPPSALKTGTPYSAATFNIGFGAYTPDFTFFMDEGVKADGTKTVGSRGTAVSRESVEACTQGAIDTMKKLGVDFVLLQEVDTDSTRSYQVNQKAAFEQAFPDYSSAFAVNFHSGFLALPLGDMHGIVNSGLLTLGNVHVDSATRRSLPVSDAFPLKFFDLDRCFLVERIPVEGGKELVLVNSHMSAYDEGGTIRAQQLGMLTGILEEEAAAGNYVIVGADLNHSLYGSEEMYESGFQIPAWVAKFDDALLPEGYSVVRADNIESVPTCRNNDVPYEKRLHLHDRHRRLHRFGQREGDRPQC